MNLVAVCTGTSFGLRRTGHAGNWSYQRYIRQYTDCVWIDGNLEITYLENNSYDLSFLSTIQEVNCVQIWRIFCFNEKLGLIAISIYKILSYSFSEFTISVQLWIKKFC